MQYIAEIDIMPLKELLDPQGKAVLQALQHLDLTSVADVRVGKHVRLHLDAPDDASAQALVEQACKQLLANPVMEQFSFVVKPA